MKTDPFYGKLKALNEQIAVDFTDEGDEGNRPVTIHAPDYVDSNYPWLYVDFGYDGPISLGTLKAIEKRFVEFCAMEGGAVDSVHMARRGQGFTVKLLYVEGKKKAPVENQGLPNDDSEQPS